VLPEDQNKKLVAYAGLPANQDHRQSFLKLYASRKSEGLAMAGL
jgi:hypothetical protein